MRHMSLKCTAHKDCSATTHCNTLQHTATHCNTLQHTAHKDCSAEFVFETYATWLEDFPSNRCKKLLKNQIYDFVFLRNVSTERPAFLLKLLHSTHKHNATESTPANTHKSDRKVCDLAGVLSIESRQGSFKFNVLHKMAQGLSAETWQGSLKFTTHTMINVLRPMTVVLYFVRFRCFDFDRIAARISFFRFFT